ncbi:hypothetical protein LTR66_015917, partial [Elasticomyces elasticus]
RLAAGRAVAEATTANQLRKAKAHEPVGTTNRPLEKMGNLHDPTAQLPASAALSTENLWIKNAPTGNSTAARHTLWVHRSSQAGFTVNLPETETMGLNSFTSVVGQVTSSKLPFYHTGTLWSLKLPQWRSSIAFKRRRTIIVTSGACKEIRSPSVLGHLRHESHIGTMAN